LCIFSSEKRGFGGTFEGSINPISFTVDMILTPRTLVVFWCHSYESSRKKRPGVSQKVGHHRRLGLGDRRSVGLEGREGFEESIKEA